MKSQKTRLLLVILGLFIASSSLMIMFASAALEIRADLANAVQHIQSVIFSKKDSSSSVNLTNSKTFARIDTKDYNFVINNNKNRPNKINTGGTVGNSILGGENNTISANSKYSVIIAGENNGIQESSGAIIGGGKNNQIDNGSDYSVIAGGSGNYVNGKYSTIAGGWNNSISGDYSVVLGVNNVVTGNVSVALGFKSIVHANNSFLWSDNDHNEILESDNTFAVVSNNGMVVNAAKPHIGAKLTIGSGGSLVVVEGEDVECTENTKGVIKAINTGGTACLCSCNGTGRTSLYGGAKCSVECGVGSSEPVCGTLKKICEDDNYIYSGSCVVGKVVEGTGAYFVDKNNKVRRTCQNEAGTVKYCDSDEPTVVPGDGCNLGAKNHCDFSMFIGGHFFGDAINTDWFGSDVIAGEIYNFEQLDYVNSNNIRCVKICEDGYEGVTDSLGKHCDPKSCEATVIDDYYFPAAYHGGESVAVKTGNTQDGSFSCTGTALCETGNFVIPLYDETCRYKCNAGTYLSGYIIVNDFYGGVVLPNVTRTYTGEDGYKYECKADIICNNGIVEFTNYNQFVGPETCTIVSEPNVSCPPTNYSGYTIGPVPNGEMGQALRTVDGLDGVCGITYSCNNGVLSFGTEFCDFNCGIGDKKSDLGRFGDSHFYSVDYTPNAWKHVNKTELNSCEYTCESSQVWSESEGCYVPGCTCDVPAHATLSSVAPTYDMTCTYNTNNNKACTFKCNDTYTWNSNTNKCVKCTGSIPSGAQANAPGVLPSDVTGYYYSTDTSKACSYSCKNDYTWNGSQCVPASYECTMPDWKYPSELKIYRDSDQNLGSDVNGRVYTSDDASAAYALGQKCIYVCRTGEPDMVKKECLGNPANMCPTINGESFIGKCELDGGSGGYIDTYVEDKGSYKEWICGGETCCLCNDGSKCKEGVDNRGCEDSSKEELEICRKVSYDFMNDHYYAVNSDRLVECGNGGYIVTDIGFYVKSGDFSDEIGIVQPFYNSYVTAPRYFSVVLDSPLGTTYSPSNEDWRRYYSCIGWCGVSTLFFNVFSALLPMPDFGDYSDSLDIDFKDTCVYEVKIVDKQISSQPYCSATSYKTLESNTYECGGKLPKNAALNDNRKVPMNGENYKCDIYSTEACAYHCGKGYVCSHQGETCVKAHSDVDCGSKTLKCSNGDYGFAWGNRLSADSLYYLSDFFTSWECYSDDLLVDGDPCIAYDEDNDVFVNSCVKDGCFELKHYTGGGEEWTGWIPTGNLGCEKDYQCRTVSHTVYDEDGYVDEYGGEFINLCDYYGKVQCYKQMYDFGVVCSEREGRFSSEDLSSVNDCGVQGSNGWIYIYDYGDECATCEKKECPRGSSALKSDCIGDVVGYSGDDPCKQCLNLSYYYYDWEGKDGDDYQDCLDEHLGDFNGVEYCKNNWCEIHGGDYYPNEGTFSPSQWYCRYYGPQDMCKCSRR